jgi:hypothetical protein
MFVFLTHYQELIDNKGRSGSKKTKKSGKRIIRIKKGLKRESVIIEKKRIYT